IFGSDKNEKTMIYIDEAWSFNVTKIGRAIKKQLERIGRSMNNALIFITQLVGDIKDEQGIAGNYGCIFAFDEDQDRDNILQLLGLESNDINYKILSNTVKGQCLFRDFYGRVSKLSVHCLFDEWTQSFKTVEKTEVAKAEERFN
ncbi:MULTISPECIES: ATP-binding protein, partial [unclassified Gemella]|uniref:ATP-binding protein n=1 Tax=unclassified Gemella TaxID=2624949 RepID=UPI001C54D9CB